MYINHNNSVKYIELINIEAINKLYENQDKL